MRSSRELMLSRLRWIAVFAVLLVASSAIPVLAADLPEQPGDFPPAAESDVVTPPSAAQVADGIESAEREEAARKRDLNLPAAIRARELSRDAFADLSSAETQKLLLDSFPEQMATLNADPARLLADFKVVKVFDETVATVEKNGDGSLLEAGIPIRTENEVGQIKKVDLDLVATRDGFEPANPLTQVRIPAAAGEPISVGDQGLAVTPAGGESAARRLGAQSVYYPEVQADTDLMIAPTAAGVELFDQLRSAASPEALRFHVALPAGTEMHANGAGGAEIAEDGKTFAYVAPPTAVDADGTNVPVELEVEGDTITIQVPHREADFRYPILVDPAIREEAENAWFYGYALEALNLSIWGYSTNDPTETYILHNFYCLNSSLCSPSGRGLFLSSMNRNIPANVYAQWYYNVPGATTYIPSIYPEYSAYLNPFWRSNNNCAQSQYPQPHDYDGSYDAGGNWQWFETDRAQWYGNAPMYTKAKGIAFGISSGGGVNIPCWRDLMLGGTVVRLDDPEAPTVSSVSGFPSGWAKANQSFTVTANISDPGLGVRNVTVFPKGRPPIRYVSEGSECPGTKTHPCPASVSAQFAMNSGLFDEGEKEVQVSGYDPTGKVSGSYSRQVKVDRTPPEIVLSGLLAEVTQEDEANGEDPEKWDELSSPAYPLHILARDGSNSSPEAKRSGVKRIEVFLDEGSSPDEVWSLPSCASSCPLEGDYDLALADLGLGKHTLKVVATDWLDQPEQRTVEFEYFPDTGDDDRYVMEHFPLPDGTDPSLEGARPWPEIAVNVTNGNVFFKQQDVAVDGPNVGLDVERVYNSLLPEDDDSEWGDGWTLAQTPTLTPVDTGGTPAPDQADVVDSSGMIEDQVALPVEAGASRFDPSLQTTITKIGSSYELKDESADGEGTLLVDAQGRTRQLTTEAAAKVEYGYDSEGDLSKIAVHDPESSTQAPPKPPTVPVQGKPTYLKSFQMQSAMPYTTTISDVARDAEGTLWVLDRNNYAVLKYSGTGQMIGGFNISLTNPMAIAIDGRGDLLIADASKHEVVIFTTAGVLKGSFGGSGTGNGKFSGAGPEGLAVDRKGNILVADTYAGRIQRFSDTGAFLSAFGTKGSAAGQLNEPRGIAVNPKSGEIWIADSTNNRIAAFTETGTFSRNFGAAGTGNGQFNRPIAIDFDNRGYGWVIDQNNNRIEGFTPAGTYYSQFGAIGTGAGQFKFSFPTGFVSDPTGRFWVIDPGNGRMQKWETPNYTPDYSTAVAGSFGLPGAGDGAFNKPADVTVSSGSIWVADALNHRIQKFSSNGTFSSKFGILGSADGQLNRPTAIDLDASGNLWVADSGNNRIQRFSSAGAFQLKAGSLGSGNGAFSSPEGIAVGPEGKIWVADTKNSRLEVFSASGQFLSAIGSKGSSPGQFLEPQGLDFGANGNVFVADAGNARIQEIDPSGGFVATFGSVGTASGQLQRPVSVEVGGEGIIWVLDSGNDRVQAFSEDGEYVSRFGSKGTAPANFELGANAGMATDPSGRIWIADTDNNRVQRWITPTYKASELVVTKGPEADDPVVNVATSEDLISAVEGPEVSTQTYDHDGDDLVAHDGPEGETSYEYDSNGLLTRVQLPNGTVASMAYESPSARVKTVTVDPAGSEPAKTTYFHYSETTLRTTVVREDVPAVDYYFGRDGSVFKIWNAVEPPKAILSGTLWVNRETPTPVATGLHNLEVQAHSNEGVASIEIFSGGLVISQQTCSQDYSTLELECKDLPDEWAVETAELPPGHNEIEVLVQDRFGHTVDERFWVNIPQTPAPPAGEPHKPTFSEIKRFRKAYGLDRDLNPVTQEQLINDRIYDLLGAWGNPNTAEGAVARNSAERWGVPLRPADVAEMEYREWFMEVDIPLVEEWVESHRTGTYAGYYVDHPNGGILHVGFTQEQATALAELKQQTPLVAQERLDVYATTPTVSVSSLKSTLASVEAAWDSDPALTSAIVSVGLDETTGTVEVAGTDVGLIESHLKATLGAQAPIRYLYEGAGIDYVGRNHTDGRIQAGDRLISYHGEYGACTAGFGAWDEVGTKANGEAKIAPFALTAGHCAPVGRPFYRQDTGGTVYPEKLQQIGHAARTGLPRSGQEYETDGSAILLNSGGLMPYYIFMNGKVPKPAGPAGTAKHGETLCFSGSATNERRCGEMVGVRRRGKNGDTGKQLLIITRFAGGPGDSGAPVWSPRTGRSIGLVSGGPAGTGLVKDWVTPLVVPRGFDSARVPGILNAPGMNSLHLAVPGE